MGETMIDGKAVNDWADERLAKQRLPLPARPTTPKPEFAFPDDPTALSSIELGQWMLRLAGYHGYALRLLSQADSELAALSAEYDLRVNQHAGEVRADLGRVNAAVVESEVVSRHDELLPLYKRRAELTTIKVKLDARAKIYEKLWQALSRELARREMEARIG